MTILIAGGCSLTYGSELKSQEHSWSSIFAGNVGLKYVNVAKPGASNAQITREVITAVEKFKLLGRNVAVAVMWTFPNRHEFRFAYDTEHKDSPWTSINPWSISEMTAEQKANATDDQLEIMKSNLDRDRRTGVHEFAETFTRHISPEYDLYTSYKEMVFLQYYLRYNRIKYLPTYATTTLFEYDKAEIKDESVSVMRNQLGTHNWMVPHPKTECRDGFYEWAKKRGFPFYSTHPGEKAHEEFAKQFTSFYESDIINEPPF